MEHEGQGLGVTWEKASSEPITYSTNESFGGRQKFQPLLIPEKR